MIDRKGKEPNDSNKTALQLNKLGRYRNEKVIAALKKAMNKAKKKAIEGALEALDAALEAEETPPPNEL